MNFELREFQKEAVRRLLGSITISQDNLSRGDEPHTIVFSAPTASGKTVMMASLIERILFGGGGLEDYDIPEIARDPSAIFLWLSDSPQLNEQSLNKMMQASDMLPLTNLIMVDQGFDQERFESGCIYYLNSQKLSKSGLLTKQKDSRNYTIWETVSNTQAASPTKFFVIIDEAHRGMTASLQERKEAESIIQRFLLGYKTAGITVPPANLVIGISATPAKFDAFLSGTKNRIRRSVDIKPSAAREAGLIKDYILLEYSEGKQTTDWTLLAEACDEYESMCSEWLSYTSEQGIDPVNPVLVIQIEDAAKGGGAASRTNLESVVQILREKIPGLTALGIAHCLESRKSLRAGGFDIRYIDPSKIQSDQFCRVVLFKTALTTGWDCPRAEVMMSFRRAEDATMIAQLVGRIVRTPLARRIDENDELNAVRLLLPRYDREELESVIRHLQDDADVVGVDIGTRAEFQLLKCAPDKIAVMEAYKKLPTYTSEEKRKTTNVRLALRFADELAIDGIEDSARMIKSALVAELLSIGAEKRADPSFALLSENIANITYRVLRVENGELHDQPEDEAKSVSIMERDVDELFRRSFPTLTDDLAKAYVTRRYKDGDEEDGVSRFKLEAFLLSQDRDAWLRMESVAGKLVDQVRNEKLGLIQQLPEGRRSAYSHLWRVSREHKIDVPVVPEVLRSRIQKDATPFDDHLFVDAAGQYRAKLNGWETAVLTEERNDSGYLTWLRNEPRKPSSVAYVYKDEKGRSVPGFPDFLIFREMAGAVVTDLLEPHRGEDSLRKAKGLCEFVEEHNLAFQRVSIIRIIDGVSPRRLDVARKKVRDKVMSLSDNDAFIALFDDPSFSTSNSAKAT